MIFKLSTKLLIIFLVLQSSHTFSQKTTIKWSERDTKKSELNILGGKNNRYYGYYINRDNELIGSIFNAEMKEISEAKINFNLKEKKYSYLGAYFLKDNITHFIHDNVRKEKKNLHLAAKTDFNLSTPENTLIIDETSVKKSNIKEFGLRNISPDSTKIIVFKEVLDNKRKKNKLSFTVYSNSLDQIINRAIATPNVKSKDYETESVHVDNTGNVYIFSKIERTGKNKKKGYSNLLYKLNVYTIDGKNKQFDFDFKEKDINDIYFHIGENRLLCTGFLKDLKGKRSDISDELFLISFDKESIEMKDSKILKLKDAYPEKLKVKHKTPYLIRKIYEKSDGGFSIVAEQHKIVLVRTKYGVTANYFYCDIICTNINNKLEINKINRIPKYQLNTINPSIKTTFKDDNTYIIYEDQTANIDTSSNNEKKLKKSKASKLSNRKNHSLFMITAYGNGDYKKEILYKYKDFKIKPTILKAVDLENGKIILSGNKNQLGILNIE